jgi:anti-sigma B factor antagonist
LRTRLSEACEGDVTVDLRRVSFLDCLGLRLLLEQDERSRARGLRVDFIQGPPAVRRVFELTGTLDRLRFVDLRSRRLARTG